MTTPTINVPEVQQELNAQPNPSKKRKSLSDAPPLKLAHWESTLAGSSFEIGIDEAGRGPMFGRVYAAAVAISPCGTFNPSRDHGDIQDSKKYPTGNRTRILNAVEYIKNSSLAWHGSYAEASEIDNVGIGVAINRCMNDAALRVSEQLSLISTASQNDVRLLVDGNYFRSKILYNRCTKQFESMNYKTVVKGDSVYASIAAASVLAKASRDDYILEMCDKYPKLSEWYGMDRHKGYGCAAHMQSIRTHGITPWHRKSFGICKTSPPAKWNWTIPLPSAVCTDSAKLEPSLKKTVIIRRPDRPKIKRAKSKKQDMEPLSAEQQPTTNDQQPMTNDQQPRTNNQEPENKN